MRACASTVGETEHRLRLADGRTLACLELGDPAGPPGLYFHGYPGSRLEARVAAAAAGRLGLRLLSVDRPGFGQSTFQLAGGSAAGRRTSMPWRISSGCRGSR